MIPKIIHYCWFGRGEMPELAQKCIESWHKYMPDWEYKLWNENNFDINYNQYVNEAYNAHKYAFVSDVSRLYALVEEGGIYLDTDVLLLKSLEPLINYKAFAGYEGSKYSPIGTCIIGSEKKGLWASEMLKQYEGRRFIKDDGGYDTTTNVSFITDIMKKQGFINDGAEQVFGDLHILPVDYFCPRRTTGEYIITENTYCDHLGIASWTESSTNWKSKILSKMDSTTRSRIIKIKRKLFG